MPRNVECHFVDEDAATIEELRVVVEDEGDGVTVTVNDGDISAHLPDLLKECEGIPLFVYLDPCGLVIPFEEVLKVLTVPAGSAPRPRRSSSTSPPSRCGGSPVT